MTVIRHVGQRSDQVVARSHKRMREKKFRYTVLAVVLLAGASRASARQTGAVRIERPRPYPVFESQAFQQAIANGTRTRNGAPGEAYWTNHAQYVIEAELDPTSRTLTGRALIRYRNRSPDNLDVIVLHLHQNLFRPGAMRSQPVPVTTGMRVSRIAVDNTVISGMNGESARPGFVTEGTNLYVFPESAVPAGDIVFLEVDWSFQVPPNGAPRGGTDGQVFFLSYWYPQIAVYDDVHGWNTDEYQGRAEFYMGYADYDVALTVPAGWLIGSTGELQNADEVLSGETRRRLATARTTRTTTHIVAAAERGAGTATASTPDGRLTWRFLARNVRDFAFGTSDWYVWDATTALAGDATGDSRPDTVLIHTLYRPELTEWAWDRSARYEQHSVEFLSKFLWPYRYPQMTAIDGPTSCSGMEYPMITCIGGQRDTLSLYSVIVHETAHMWFPMMVGSNETRHSWQDEGLTRFNQSESMQAFFDGHDRWSQSYEAYRTLAREDAEVELMRHGDLYPRDTNAFGVASYEKMSLILRALRGLLGDDVFLSAYREYGRRWLFKHPTPYDFFNTFAEVAGDGPGAPDGVGGGLWWFWRSWFYETWTLDQAVADVATTGDSTRITVEDLGLVPMPVKLTVTREDGRSESIDVPVDTWLEGRRRVTLSFAASPRIVRVEIDPDNWFPDLDRTNNTWPR